MLTVISQRIYELSFYFRSQAPSSPVCTGLADRLGVIGNVGKQFFFLFRIGKYIIHITVYQLYRRVAYLYNEEHSCSCTITEVKLRWARLVMGWVAVTLGIPSAVRKQTLIFFKLCKNK